MADRDELDTTLERLTKSTELLGPRAGFAARVMDALEPAAPGFIDAALRSSRRVLPAALLVAALAAVWAVRANGVDESLAASYGAMELDW